MKAIHKIYGEIELGSSSTNERGDGHTSYAWRYVGMTEWFGYWVDRHMRADAPKPVWDTDLTAIPGEGNSKNCSRCGTFYDGHHSDADLHTMCFTCNFWTEHAANRDNPAIARIDGKHYIIGPNVNQPSSCKGFGGRKFFIKFHDGRFISTTNLWHQGTIPESFRAEMPDNAEFMES